MKLFHVTPRRNKVSIFEHGLLRRFAKVPTKEIFLCSRVEVKWLVEHVRNRHGDADVCVLYVNAPRTLRRMSLGFLYAVAVDIPPRRILGELAWED